MDQDTSRYETRSCWLVTLKIALCFLEQNKVSVLKGHTYSLQRIQMNVQMSSEQIVQPDNTISGFCRIRLNFSKDHKVFLITDFARNFKSIYKIDESICLSGEITVKDCHALFFFPSL